jgi:hypothetical protein
MHRHHLPGDPNVGDVAACTCCRVFFARHWDDNVGAAGVDWYPLHWWHRITRPLVYERARQLRCGAASVRIECQRCQRLWPPDPAHPGYPDVHKCVEVTA